ncbi:response regulator [Chryseobacterium arthrosphaerae]|uniref:Response regulator n=1 Tax=Chryseobacterium arthrosphaerae TaxID=651561 RepID=A0ABU7QY47_9FLAO|nr:response regulator [Chryseobacterium arthrosphaerae]AYZ10771.1 response regulator [Chryseobacterium arthrosphaerae]MDG4652877.1 response regulator [Chryseobacterium arthrosphaerae]WES97337.1 response regulator [Chryseobacterium arthrosphaerae]
MNKEFLNVIVADNDENTLIFFKNILKELKISIKVQCFSNGKSLMEYLNHEDAVVPEIVFIKYRIPGKDSMECLDEIHSDLKFSNMVTAIYSEPIPEDEIEDIFVKGANIYMKKPEAFEALKKVLTEVITINWQYYTSGLNKDNFILKV